MNRVPKQSKRSRAVGPHTVAGLWLRAFLMRDAELRDELRGQLNGGKKGWSRDEAGVMQAACDLAVLRYFGTSYDVRDISALVSRLRQARLDAGNTPRGQLEMEAIIRHALGEVDVDITGINAQVAFEVQGGVTAYIAWKSGYTEPQIDELITKAEQMAVARGLNPPLALKQTGKSSRSDRDNCPLR